MISFEFEMNAQKPAKGDEDAFFIKKMLANALIEGARIVTSHFLSDGWD